MRFSKTLIAAASLVAASAVAAQERPIGGYSVTPDVVYGSGIVRTDGVETTRDLWMDVWQPTEATAEPRPTVIFTHGGSWHLGSPRFTYDVGGAQTTAPSDYCRTYVSRGYNCFAIGYRLTQEHPVPTGAGYSQEQLDPDAIIHVIERVNQVRVVNGLAPLNPNVAEDQATMMNGIRAATEDLNTALSFILENAESYQVDPDRIVLQGFSAGGVTSVHVAYALNAPVAGVIATSGGAVGFDITQTVTSDSPPMLLFVGQHDLEGAIELAPVMRDIMANAGVPFEFAWVPGAGHFYPQSATSLGADVSRRSIESRIANFLDRTFAE